MTNIPWKNCTSIAKHFTICQLVSRNGAGETTNAELADNCTILFRRTASLNRLLGIEQVTPHERFSEVC